MRLILSLLLLAIVLFQTVIVLFDIPLTFGGKLPIKVGVIYSTTGFRADAESPAQAATLMAIEEINRKGGILGRKIEPIITDAESSWQKTQQIVEQLILQEDVAVFLDVGRLIANAL